MVDFSSYISQKQQLNFKDLLELYESLDRQTSHTELRPAQIESLAALTTRRNEKDIILKISTGAGKTAIGLIFLYSHMEESGQPVVYLCPTKQLVEQVCQEAGKLGIKAVCYPGSETYPHHDGIAAKAVIVCTYDKLFNGKTTFDRKDVMLRPTAIVMDDVHAGMEEIRDSYTLKVPVDLTGAVHKILRATCSKYKKGTWDAIENGDPAAIIEVPFWIWRPLAEAIGETLAPFSQRKELLFQWPYLRDIFRWCRCIVSGTGIEIVPEIIPAVRDKAFHGATHRLFMSATLADDSALVRDLGCCPSAALNPIVPAADKGLGERMVLVPSLVDKGLNRAWVMSICGQAAAKGIRTVVLAPNEYMARQWEPYGAKVVLGDEVSSIVGELKTPGSKTSFVVFVQRYDGVDLADNACRLLVIDGLPTGENIVDKHDNSMTSVAGGSRNTLTYRIEQGMGRAVRSHVDYAAVILVGDDLVNFVARKEVQNSMNSDTRLQLKLAQELVKIAADSNAQAPGNSVVDMLNQCLNRNEGWKKFYEERVKKQPKEGSSPDQPKIQLAQAERSGVDSVLRNDIDSAVRGLRAALNEYKAISDYDRARKLQQLASYLWDINSEEAYKTQRAAHQLDSNVMCPPQCVVKPVSLDKFEAQSILLKWFQQFTSPNGAVAELENLKARLSYGLKSEAVEQALFELAGPLGAKGDRPEKFYGEGPDDLWVWPSHILVIEAKTGNQETLHEEDSGQMHKSIYWCNQNYPIKGNVIPVVVADVIHEDDHATFPADTRVITQAKMMALLGDLQNFYITLAQALPIQLQVQGVKELQAKFGLLPEQFIGRYSVAIKTKKAK